MEYDPFTNYRFLLTSHTHFEQSTLSISSMLLGVGFVTDRPKPIIDIYSITQERYKLADNYKIGLVGNPNYLTPNEQFYISDLRSILQGAKDPLVGVYEAYQFSEGNLPKLTDLIVTTTMSDEHRLQQVWKVTKVRKGWMAMLFGNFQLKEINGLDTMNLSDFQNTEDIQIEILKETGFPFKD